MIELSNQNYQEVVENSPRAVLLDVWAPWCAPCKAIEPMLSELSAQYPKTLTVASLNVDAEPALAQAIGVGGLPTVRLIKNGAVLYQAIGSVDRLRLTAAVAAALV